VSKNRNRNRKTREKVMVHNQGYRSWERGHPARLNASGTLALPGFTLKREQLREKPMWGSAAVLIVLMALLLVAGCTQEQAPRPHTSPGTAGSGPATRPVAGPTRTPTPEPLPVRRALFPKPPKDGTTAREIAREASLIILTKNDESFRDAVRAAGYNGLILEYITASDVDAPPGAGEAGDSCDDSTFTPWNNQVAYEQGDFCNTIHPNEDWFLHNGRGERLYEQGEDRRFYYLNPASEGWRAFVVGRLLRLLEGDEHHAPLGYDGIFLDNVPLSLDKVRDKLENSDGTVQEFANDAAYRAAWLSYLRDVSDALHPRWPVWARLISDPLDGRNWELYLPHLDGAMSEAFATNWPGATYTPDEWQASLTQAEQVLAMGKGYLAQSHGEDDARQPFALASFLLIADGTDTFFRYSKNTEYSKWLDYENYRVHLGAPRGARYHLGAGRWRRDFTSGYVVVDPVAQKGQIVASGAMTTTAQTGTSSSSAPHSPSPPAASTSEREAIGEQAIRQAFFYRPPDDGTMSWEVAERADMLILSKKDERYRNAVRMAGYEGLVLQYVVASEAEGPAAATSSAADCVMEQAPWNNQVVYEQSDFCTHLHPNEDWFLHNGSGERIYTDEYGHIFYHMDPGNAGWRAFVVARLLRFLEGEGIYEPLGYDGIFLDNIELSLTKVQEQMDNSDGVVQEYATEGGYQAAWLDYLRDVSDALRLRWPVWANLIADPLDGRSWKLHMPYLDGIMNESFATGWPWSTPFGPAEWEATLQQAEETLAMGKGYLAQSQGEDDALQSFALASYLLITDGQQAFFRYSTFAEYSEWKDFPNYHINLGTPLGARYQQEDGRWRRDFRHGYVVVDPQTQKGKIVSSHREEDTE
jgi:hypothetical protein